MDGHEQERAYRSNVVITSISEVLNLGVRTLASIAVARALGPTDRGEYSLALLIPGLFLTLTSFGLGEASAILIGQKRFPLERVVGCLLTYNVLLSALLAAVYFGFSHLIVAFTNNNIHLPLYSLGFLYIPLMLFWGNFSAVSLGLGQVRQVGYGRLLNNALFLVLIAVLYFTTKITPIVALCVFIAGGVAEIAYLLYYVRRHTRITLSLDPAIMKEQMQFGVKFMLGGIFTQLNRRLNSYLVVLYLGNYWLGIFTVSIGLADLLLMIPTVFARASFSVSARSTCEEERRIAAASVRQISFFLMVSAVALAFIARPAITLLYTNKFADSFLPLLILLPGTVALGAGVVLGYVLVGNGLPQVATKASGISCVFSVVLNFLLIPKFGIKGAAVATTLASCISGLYLVEVYRRMNGMSLKELLLVRRSDFVSYGGDIRRIFGKLLSMGGMKGNV